MRGKSRIRNRLIAVTMVIALLVTPMQQVQIQGAGFVSQIANSALVENISKLTPAVKGATAAIEFASKVYNAVEYAMDAEDGKEVKAFLDCFMGKVKEPSTSDIMNTLEETNGKIDAITDSVNELNNKIDAVLTTLNGLVNQLGDGIKDIKVQLYESELRMQNWDTLYSSVKGFYDKYSNVRGTLQTTITTLNNRAIDYEKFIAEIDKLDNAAAIHAAIAKLNVSFDNYDSLSDEEKALLSTTITVDGTGYQVYTYVKNYVEYVREELTNTYNRFTGDYETDMYATLVNMGDAILGTKWQAEGQGGIGEIFYKLCLMKYSNSEEVHDAYREFISSVQYDFIMTAYVCSLALRSDISYYSATGNAQKVATAREQLENIYKLIGRIMVYSEYEYEKCVKNYDFNGFVPDGNLSYEDYVVYYGNSVNAVATGAEVTKTYFVSKKAMSLGDNIAVSNQNMYLAAGETAQFKVWCDGIEVQSEYDLYSSSDCVAVNADGTVVALRPGTATISMKIQGVKRDVAIVTVSSCYAKYNGNKTDKYIYYEGDTKKSLELSGVGYEYEYNSDITSVSMENAIDSSKDLWLDLSNCITFENDVTINDFTINLNHKYGRIEKTNGHTYLQLTHAYVGALTLSHVVDEKTCVIVIPIINSAKSKVQNSSVTKKDSDTSICYIYTKEDLLEWRAYYEKNNSTKVNVKLMADIDFEWGNWEGLQYALAETTPGASMTDLPYLDNYKTYTFDGNGHTIKNITFVPTEVDMYVYGESQTEREVVEVNAYGFFAKLGGTIKNLTIENVKYSGYPAGRNHNGKPQILSVFAALGNSEIHGKTSGSGGDRTYTWTSEVSNCRATGLTETVTTEHVMYYDPFGNMFDQMNGNTNQKITVKNCVYDMHFEYKVDNLQVYACCGTNPIRYVSIFSSTESNIYAGNVSCYNVAGFDYHKVDVSLLRTDGMSAEDIAEAKENLIAIEGGKLNSINLSEYKISLAESIDKEFWTSRGWNEAAVDRMLNGNTYPLCEGDFSVDISKLKGFYFLGEQIDGENIYVNGQSYNSYTLLGDINTPGTKTVSIDNERATFTVEYVGFVELKFTNDSTTHSYNAITGKTFTLPNALFEYTGDDGKMQTGWKNKGTGEEYSLGATINVTNGTTFEPIWGKSDKYVEISFGDQVIKVPLNTTIVIPYPPEGAYNPDTHNAHWVITKDGYGKQFYFGQSVKVDQEFANLGTIWMDSDTYVLNFGLQRVPRMDFPWALNIYFQNLEDDGYTYIGTTNGKNMAGYTFQNSYEYAFSNLGYPVYNMNIAFYVVRAEAENCEKINDLGYKVTANQEVSELTIWVDRPVLTVTWKDIAGNTIKTEDLRYGAMPTPPTDAEAAPAGYTVAWDKEIVAVKEKSTTYQVSSHIPMSGIQYTVNHMLQDITGDGYTLKESEILTGTTGESTAAVAQNYTGFTALQITQESIAGDGSTVINIYYERNKYTVTWDINGETVTEQYRYGATPVWKYETPTKPSDGVYTYTFVGWGEIEAVTDHVTYTAQFDSDLNQYTITWDIDGVTTTEVYTYGDIPEWKGEIPQRDATAQYTYVFKDWGEITSVTGDKTYIAVFTPIINKYTITWIVGENSFEEEYEYGTTPVYKGITPIKPSDEKGSYTFSGWGQMEVVTGDKSYTAQFICNVSTYTITWDVNGEKLTELYSYGEIPSYKGVTPIKPATAKYFYTFVGWGDITEVTGDKTYTALFDETINTYTIIWNIDGKQIIEVYEYGKTPSYKGELPTRVADAQYTYSFRDWGTILTVTEDKTYTATFNATVNKYNITWIIDGIQFTESYDYGAMPAYKGYAPTKAATAQYIYTFVGWGDIMQVTANKTYTAIFDKTVNRYNITWDIDGVKITEEYEYGEIPSYKGEVPIRDGNAQYTYTFRDWGSILTVTGDKIYSARFNEIINKYIVTWVVNGNETTEEYEYGVMPSFKGEKPTKPATAQYTYEFKGWGNIVEVTENKTYTAEFDAIYLVPDEIVSPTYKVEENTIGQITPGTSSKDFLSRIDNNQYCQVLYGDEVVSEDAPVGTGMTVVIKDGDKEINSYIIVVTGDTNGDGAVSITDMLVVKSSILGKNDLTGAYAAAADISGDDEITITDFLQLKAQLLGKGNIGAN